MRRLAGTPILLASILVLLGCSSLPSEEIPFSKFRNYGDTPLEHTLYLGSDAEFHYFVWSSGKSSGRWHVHKSEMPFECERPRGRIESPIFTDAQGHPQPHVPGCVPDAPAAQQGAAADRATAGHNRLAVQSGIETTALRPELGSGPVS